MNPVQIHLVWESVEPHLQRAVETSPGRWTTGDLFLACSRGQRILWVVHVEKEVIAAFTACLNDYPQGQIYTIDWVGGDRLKDWLPLALENIEKHARFIGCSKIEGHGRKGWEKSLTKDGWKMLAVSYEKDLEYEQGRESSN